MQLITEIVPGYNICGAYRRSRSPHNVEGQKNVVLSCSQMHRLGLHSILPSTSSSLSKKLLVAGRSRDSTVFRRWFLQRGCTELKQRLPLLVAAAADVGRRNSSTKNTSTLHKPVVQTFAHSLSPSRHFHLRSTAMATDTSKPPDPEQKPRNKLAAEKSPYLQQHASNPVHW